jgi:hypothetical protein
LGIKDSLNIISYIQATDAVSFHNFFCYSNSITELHNKNTSMGEYNGMGKGAFEALGNVSKQERDTERHLISRSFEDKVAQAAAYAAEIAHAEKMDMRHQYMIKQSTIVKALLHRVGGFEQLTEEACQTVVDNDTFFDATIVYAIAQALHKDSSLKH